jgi:RNA recognition motif-containing protein
VITVTLFVAGLPSTITEHELRDVFAPYGSVRAVRIPTDRVSCRTSRGFGFVVLDDLAAARTAIDQLSGRRFHDRVLTVRVARPSPTYGARARSSVPAPNDHHAAIDRRRLGNG